MIVKNAMHSITKVDVMATISEAARVMDRKNIGSVLIEREGKVVGIVTERDILGKVVAAGADYNKMKVKNIMSTSLIEIDSNAYLEEASRLLSKNNVRRLVVIEGGKIVGMITARNIAEKARYSLASRLTRSKVSKDYRPSYGRTR